MSPTAYARGDYATALRYLEQSLKISQAIGDRSGESVTCFNIGMIYRQFGDLDQAIEYVARTVALDEAIGHPDLESDRAMLERLRLERADH